MPKRGFVKELENKKYLELSDGSVVNIVSNPKVTIFHLIK